MTTKYIVTVRALARLKQPGGNVFAECERDDYIANWSRQWTRCGRWRDTDRHPGKSAEYITWVPRAEHPYLDAIDRGACLFLLGFEPDRSGNHLDEILRTGAPAVFWRSVADGQDLQQTLLGAIAADKLGLRKRPGDLPYALYFLRRDAWEQSKRRHPREPDSGAYHLLWDDPTRIPDFNGLAAKPNSPAQRLTSPF